MLRLRVRPNYGVFTPYADGGNCTMFTKDSMKQKLTGLSKQYAVALRKHLKQGPSAGMHRLWDSDAGQSSLGLETLELARIHEQAITTLELAKNKDGTSSSGRRFFLPRPITPIVRNASRRAAEQDAIIPAERDAEPAHAGAGRHEPPVAAGHRPAQDRGSRPQEKRETLHAGC